MPPKQQQKKKKKKMSAREVAAKALRGAGAGERKAKGVWKTKEVGGGLLAWDPYGAKTLERYATKEEHDQFVDKGGYRDIVYDGSTAKAIWFRTLGGTYEASFAEKRPWKVTVVVSINEETPLVHVEVWKFKGEAGYLDGVIVKQNEKGAYGIGRNLIDKLKPKWEENKKR